MSKLFISYRRADSAATCDRIYERLAAHFGRDSVFKDIQNIGLGSDFRQVIQQVIAQCNVQLVVIGPQWISIKDERGRRRLDDPADLVRQEVEAALERKIQVIPVLVQGASLPPAKNLPSSLRKLPNLNSAHVRYDPDFDVDMQRLCLTLEQWITPLRPTALSGKSDGARTDPRTHIVNPLERNGYLSISEAIQVAQDGDRILVRPGRYVESITIEKSLEIIGDGKLGEINIECDKTPVITFKADHGRIANLTLRQLGGGMLDIAARHTVDIARGRLELEDCDISSLGQSCVAIHGGAFAFVRRNRIHDSASAAIYISDSGQGIIEDNDISGAATSGVSIDRCGDLTVRRNRIHDNKFYGISINHTAACLIEDNDICAHKGKGWPYKSGMDIDGGSNPTVRHNRIYDNLWAGVSIYNHAQGLFEDNDIFENGLSGVRISKKGNPTVRRNRIHDQAGAGVWIEDDGRGVIEDNDILANEAAGVWIGKVGNPVVRGNRINKNARGVIVRDGGRGVFEDNDLRGNTKGTWDFGMLFGLGVKRTNNDE